MIENLRPLTQEQRQAARKTAREVVIRAAGPRPTREQFTHTTISLYPSSVTRLIFLLCLVLLLAAFTPSAIRLYVIGSQTFGQAVTNSAAKTAVGFATILSAEIGQVVFSLALATLGTSRSARRLLILSMMLATMISLAGNIQLALPGHERSPFAWLEAMAPPIIVLSTAYVIKEQLLETVETRHANERAFQADLSEWHKATAYPENHPQWSQFYANALRDMLNKANNRRQETLAALTTVDWRALVYRELQTEHWYSASEEDYIPARTVQEMEPVPLAVRAKRNGNGAHAGTSAV